ncbi:MAG TPA: DUF2142 domain-containing protein [Acidimicrobiales bacterium]|nr:DUF2142 domain-containing protein [Acidimicrobiales bacterium]
MSRRPLAFGAIFALAFLLSFATFGAWSLATPLYASPDEPTQVAHAAAAVRGQLVGTTITSDANALTAVSVPRIFATGWLTARCYAFRPTVPASCSPSIPAPTETVRTTTYVGRYPPLYYLIVGLPSLAVVSTTGIYLMRLTSALLNALLISVALLVVALWSDRKLLFLGVAVAATPTAWFFGGMVNPSGFAICAAVCLWTSGLVLVLEHADRPPPALVAVVAGATALLLLARPISPLWAAITYAALGLLGGRRAVAGVWRSRAARLAALPLLGCAAFALWWVDTKHSFDLTAVAPAPASESDLHVLGMAAGHTWGWLQQMVGVFGWLDTPSPLLTYGVWFAVVAAFALLAVVRTGARRAAVLLLLVAAVFAVPIALTYAEARRLGMNGQGRYWLPLAVGVPLVSVALVEHTGMGARVRSRVALTVSIAIAVADIAAFVEAIRRYAVGVTGPADFLVGTWHPPLGLLGAAVAGSTAFAALLAALAYGVHRGQGPPVSAAVGPPPTGDPSVPTLAVAAGGGG